MDLYECWLPTKTGTFWIFYCESGYQGESQTGVLPGFQWATCDDMEMITSQLYHFALKYSAPLLITLTRIGYQHDSSNCRYCSKYEYPPWPVQF